MSSQHILLFLTCVAFGHHIFNNIAKIRMIEVLCHRIEQSVLADMSQGKMVPSNGIAQELRRKINLPRSIIPVTQGISEGCLKE